MPLLSRLATALLLAVLLLAGSVRAEETPAPEIDPAEVGRRLLSADEAQRAKGEAMLLERIRRGGDLAGFLKKMAAAQARMAGRATRMVERWLRLSRDGSQQERERARRILEALALGSDARPPGEASASPAPTAAAPPIPIPSPTAPSAPRPAAAEEPTRTSDATKEADAAVVTAEAEGKLARGALSASWVVDAGVTQVAARELLDWLQASQDASHAREAAGLRDGRAMEVRGTRALVLLEAANNLPETRLLGAVDRRVVSGEPVKLAGGVELAYRRGLRRTKKGAWAVQSDSLAEGLSVFVHLERTRENAAQHDLVVSARHVVVPRPLPVEKVRPEPNIEPVEVDVPEWRAASASLRVAPKNGASGPILVLFPGLQEDQVILVRLEALPPRPAALDTER